VNNSGYKKVPFQKDIQQYVGIEKDFHFSAFLPNVFYSSLPGISLSFKMPDKEAVGSSKVCPALRKNLFMSKEKMKSNLVEL